MTPKRLSAKFFLTPGDVTGVVTQPTDVVPVFHNWIGRQLVEEVLIDVADYSHVHQGPAVMLVALEADYVFDLAGGLPGIRYIRKRSIPDSLPSALAQSVAAVAQAAHLLQESTLIDGVAFDVSHVEIEILDKLNYPYRDERYTQFEEALQRVGAEAYAGEVAIMRTIADPRRPVKLELRGNAATTLDQIVSRLRGSRYLQDLYAEVIAG